LSLEREENNRPLKVNEVFRSKQFLDTLNGLNEALVIVDTKLEIIYCNRSTAKLFNMNSIQEPYGEIASLNSQIYALIPNKLDDSELNRRQKPKKSVHLMTGKNGSEIWVETRTFPLTNEENQKLGFAIVIKDITEKAERQNEQEYYKTLKVEVGLAHDRAWNQLQTLLELLDEPFMVLDSEFRLTYVNKAAEEALGKSRKELIGQNITRIIPDIKRTKFYHHLISKNRSSKFREYFAPLGIWIDCSIYAWKENNNNSIGIQFRDASENVLLERQISESEENYRQLVNSIHDPFFGLDKNLRVTYWNEDFEKLTKIPSPQALGRHIRELVPESKSELDNVFLEALASKKPKNSELKLHYGNLEAVFEVYVYPSAKGLSVLCRDVTETRRMESELKKYNAQLQQLVEERTNDLKDAERLAAIGQTAGMVGHDIRNPLQSIIACLYLANEEAKNVRDIETKQQLIESLQTIEEQVSYINKIITDLQDFARKLKPVLEKTDIKEIFRSVIGTIQVPPGVRIEYAVEPRMPELKTDKTFITRIFTNLINNAIQATPKGGEITLQAKQKSSKAVLTVEDNGSGIPEEVKPKLFMPLFTTKAKGQGFGLAVVKRLTEALGGTISFESEAGKGTKFTLEIPFQPNTIQENKQTRTNNLIE